MTRPVIRLARPLLDDAERRACAAVLATGMLVQGEQVAAFEAQLATLSERPYAIACSSGTTALELALEALEVRGGEMLCPALTWPSPAHAIVRAGARPVLVDVGPTWNATAGALAAARTERTRAAIVIDQFGMPAEHPAIAAALGDLPIVVDAACSLGASIGGRPSTAYGRIACTSFHPRKVVTTGEGGACFTSDTDLAARLRRLRNHGQQAAGVFVEPGPNARLTELQAAMGIVQLTKLATMVERRRALAARYQSSLAGRFELQEVTASAEPNWQTFGVVLDTSAGRDALLARLAERGVEGGKLSYALSLLPSLAPFARPCPNAERIAACGLALPLHPALTDEEQDRVLEAL
ncbi:MAG: DegT/DnrJ/EryC1/StrS family aminotransferase [Sandaracinaceae bacterium]|nr:DegT/DnrJ/EryC1/StrS family aminotransferase [Sandaracinaceae bacterium]